MRCGMMPMLVLFVCPSGCGASLCSGFVVHGVLHNFKTVMMLGRRFGGCCAIGCVLMLSVGVWFCRLFSAVRDDADVGFVCVSIGLCGASLCSGFVVHGVLHNFKDVMMLG